MRMIAIIPARGGSKGVPRKNVRPLAGRPLIAYSIDGVYLDLLVNEIGSYHGEVLLPEEDPMVMSVHSPGGTWSWSAVEQ